MKRRNHKFEYVGKLFAKDEYALTDARGVPTLLATAVDAIRFYCPNDEGRICLIPLTLGDPIEGPPRRWHWDGNFAAPTITPSIGCDARCGWHGHIIGGDFSP